MQQEDTSTGYAQTNWDLTRAKQGTQVISKTINVHLAAKTLWHSANS